MSTVKPQLVRAFIDRYGLDLDDLPRMARLLNRCAKVVELTDGDWLCHEKDPANGLYMLAEGSLRVQKRDARNEYRDIAVAEAPAIMGHMGLLTGVFRTAGLCADPGGATVFLLSSTDVDVLMKDNGQEGDLIRRVVLGAMLDQLDRATRDVQTRINSGDSAPLPDGWVQT